MASIILIGPQEKAETFIVNYIKENRIPPHGIERFVSAKIEHTREIKKKLAFRAASERIFIFAGEITVEAQNALLKSIEEHSSTVHFLFSVEREDILLSTVHSRCLMVRLEKQEAIDTIPLPVGSIFSNDIAMWSKLDEVIVRVNELGVDALVFAMRAYMFDNINDKRTLELMYPSCKRMLGLLNLVKNNNVSIRTFVEKTFIPSLTISKNV